MNKKQLQQLFRRKSGSDEHIWNMPQEYKDGWYAGNIAGREAQRKADIEVAFKLLKEKA